MEHQPAAFTRRYSAFISYSHADRRIAARIARRIERFRLPRQIARRIGVSRLKPVFRDREELTAAADLGTALREAIAHSDYLIVVCTRHTPASEWVGREIALFRATHDDDHILTALCDHPAGDCFHAELRHGADGGRISPLAADFTRAGDGSRLALLKLIAPLAGVALDDLVRRDAQRQVRRIWLAAGAAVLLLAAMTVATLLTLHARATAAEERERGTDAMRYQLTDLRRKVQAGGTLALADAVDHGVERFYGRGASDTVEARIQRATVLHGKIDTDEKRGRFADAWKTARAAYAATAPLLHERPDDPEAIFIHAQSAYFMGYIAWRMGDVPFATRGYGLYARLADRLVRAEPEKDRGRLEQGYAASNLGMLTLREAHDWPRARQYFTAAQAAFVAAGQRGGDQATVLYEREDGEAWLADVDRLSGDLVGAEAHRRTQRSLIERLMAAEPSNRLYRVDLVANRLGMARIAAARGRRNEALGLLADAGASIGDLSETDPDNASIARQKRAIELFRVETWLSGSRSAWPRGAVIDELLDCAADLRAAKGEELGAFCIVLRARFEMLRGRGDAAWRLLETPLVAVALKSPTLSPRWRLNFAEERGKLTAEMARRGE